MFPAVNTYWRSGFGALESFGICESPRYKRRKRRKSARPIRAKHRKDRPLMEIFQSRWEKLLRKEQLFFKLMYIMHLYILLEYGQWTALISNRSRVFILQYQWFCLTKSLKVMFAQFRCRQRSGYCIISLYYLVIMSFPYHTVLAMCYYCFPWY